MPYTYEHGSGTEQDPYQVWTANDLDGVRDYINGNYFIQMTDVDLSEYENWEPIAPITYTENGLWDFDASAFTGTYDGNNYKILNLKIDNSTQECIGLFGVANNAMFKNIHIKDADITVYYIKIDAPGGHYGGEEVGTLVGQVRDSIVENCSSTGVINCYGGNIVGGLIGHVRQDDYSKDLIINRCGSSVNINSLFYPIPNAYGNNISGLFNAGGLIGMIEGAYPSDSERKQTYITNSYATGNILFVHSDEDVNGDNWLENCGGFVGEPWGCIVEKCCAKGNVKGLYGLGGFMGQGSDYIFRDCYARGNVIFAYEHMYARENTEDDYGDFGGFAGHTRWDPGEFINCYCTGKVPVGDFYNTAGFQPYDDKTVVNCYYDYTISQVLDPLAMSKTTKEMTYPYDTSVNQTYVDWDFGSIWHHDYRGSLNDGYPQFEITAPAVKKFIFKVPYKI